MTRAGPVRCGISDSGDHLDGSRVDQWRVVQGRSHDNVVLDGRNGISKHILGGDARIQQIPNDISRQAIHKKHAPRGNSGSCLVARGTRDKVGSDARQGEAKLIPAFRQRIGHVFNQFAISEVEQINRPRVSRVCVIERSANNDLAGKRRQRVSELIPDRGHRIVDGAQQRPRRSVENIRRPGIDKFGIVQRRARQNVRAIRSDGGSELIVHRGGGIQNRQQQGAGCAVKQIDGAGIDSARVVERRRDQNVSANGRD